MVRLNRKCSTHGKPSDDVSYWESKPGKVARERYLAILENKLRALILNINMMHIGKARTTGQGL